VGRRSRLAPAVPGCVGSPFARRPAVLLPGPGRTELRSARHAPALAPRLRPTSVLRLLTAPLAAVHLVTTALHGRGAGRTGTVAHGNHLRKMWLPMARGCWRSARASNYSG